MSTRALVQRLKPVAARFGIQSAKRLYEAPALRQHLRKQQSNSAYREWLQTEGGRWVEWHWAHSSVNGAFDRAHLASQLFEITELLRRRLPSLGSARVLDAGASDGFFLTRLGARGGVGLNLLSQCAERINTDGHRSCVADVERLPFIDGSFDYVICCETLEHVPDPIATLRELVRVCRRRIHLTIPWLAETRINPRATTWPECDSHVFEFNEADFARVLTHVPARLTFKTYVQVFPEPRNPLLQWWFKTFMYGSYFPKLQYYELEPMHASEAA